MYNDQAAGKDVTDSFTVETIIPDIIIHDWGSEWD